MQITNYQPRPQRIEAIQVPPQGTPLPQDVIAWLDCADTPYTVHDNGSISVMAGAAPGIMVGRKAKPGDMIYKVGRTLKVTTAPQFKARWVPYEPPYNSWQQDGR